jgi:outer membrane protein assembly factor BamB
MTYWRAILCVNQVFRWFSLGKYRKTWLTICGLVYVGSNDGRFYVLDFAKGTKLWELNACGAASASPAIASGRLVIGYQKGKLYCFG